jgi:hypothetical protein
MFLELDADIMNSSHGAFFYWTREDFPQALELLYSCFDTILINKHRMCMQACYECEWMSLVRTHFP